jgi:hypothetical protein
MNHCSSGAHPWQSKVGAIHNSLAHPWPPTSSWGFQVVSGKVSELPLAKVRAVRLGWPGLGPSLVELKDSRTCYLKICYIGERIILSWRHMKKSRDKKSPLPSPKSK